MHGPPGPGRLVAEAVPGQRRTHDVEGIGRVAAVRDRIAKGPDHFWNSTTEPGQPCVSTSGSASGLRRADVHDVDAQAVELGAELRERVEPLLAAAPVVLLRPVAAELLHVRERDALRPVVDRLRLGPAGPGQAITRSARSASVTAIRNGSIVSDMRHLRARPQRTQARHPRGPTEPRVPRSRRGPHLPLCDRPAARGVVGAVRGQAVPGTASP